MSNEIKKARTQENLEQAILKYQKSLSTNNNQLIDRDYKEVCKLYPPLMHMAEWWNQYHYLYDSQEDFTQDYIRVFCNVLSNWKPRGIRKKSRYDGTGEFKNYFIGALQHNYINLVKADNAGKRNPYQKCPICETWVNPLSTHILNHHGHILWDHLEATNIKIHEISRCPFCKSHKMPRTFECLEQCENKISGGCDQCKKSITIAALKKHFLSKHSSMLFQKFNQLYPNYQTISPRAMSVYMAEEEDDENCYYDHVEDTNKLDNLLQYSMSDLESKIINLALNGTKDLRYDSKVYNCSFDEFQEALENIKNKMALVGLEG